MTNSQPIQIVTLFVSAVSAGGAIFAALLAGRFQRNSDSQMRDWQQAQAERERVWERASNDRIRGLDQVRAAYEAEVKSLTLVEQLMWAAVHRKTAGEEPDDAYRMRLRELVREHSMTHAVVQLVGSATVVKQADLVGRDITNAMRAIANKEMAALGESRSKLISLMRKDLELAAAPITDAPILYGESKR